MAKDDNKTFQDFFAEGMENLASTAFPQLSKFMDFSRDKKKDEDKASDSVNEQEDEDKPSRRRKSVNAVANEMVLDSLGAIDERLKVQSIVLVSQLEQQTITNQLLTRLATGGGMGGVGGSGGGGGGAGGVVDAATNAIGGAAIGNFIKSWGTKILGGAVSALMLPEVAIPAAVAAAGVGTVVGGNALLRASDNEDMGPNAKNKTGDALQAEITALRADVEREKQHLALNPTDTATLAILKKLEEKLDKDLGNAAVDDTKKAATHNYGPWHYGGTPYGPIIQNPGDIPTSVSSPMSASGMPPLHNGGAYAPTEVPSGQTPWSIVHGGGSGTPAGGGGGGGDHPAGPGGYRATGAGRISPDSIDKGIKLRDHLMKEYGMTKEQATGFTGTLMYESGNFHSLQEQNPVGGGQGGWGWAQWTNSGGGKRRDEFMANAQEHGLDPKSDEAQISMVDKELKGKYAKALEAIKKTNTVEEASLATLEKYEGMPDTAAIRAQGGIPATRQHIQRSVDFAAAAAKKEGQSAGPDETFTPPKDTGEVLDHIAKARDLGLVNGDECVALAAGAVGVRLDGQHGAGSNVHGWRRGEAVMGSKLKPGTAVATFFDRNGNPTQDYAHGSATGGDPGKQLDHAGSIVGYDADGKGFTLADQWGAHNGRPGSGGTHVTHVREGGLDPRTGRYNRELDPSSYAAVKTEDGQYLGGKNSPMALHDETGMPHRPASLGSLKGIINNGPQPRHPDSASAIMRGRRPEEGRNTAADALDLQQYKKDFDAYSENQRENNRGNAFRHQDTSKTVASALVQTSHENALKESLRVRHNPVVQQFNSEHGGTPDLTVNTKSGRLSDKDVGSANPPAHRLKELFVSSENTKGF